MNHGNRFDGWFYSSLTEEEQREIDALIVAGFAYLSYEGTAGFLGLAKVRYHARTEGESEWD